jgi:hypothetical protein
MSQGAGTGTRFGCCTGTLLVVTAGLLFLMALLISPYPMQKAPPGSVMLHIGIGPQTGLQPASSEGFPAWLSEAPHAPAIVRLTETELSEAMGRFWKRNLVVFASPGTLAVQADGHDAYQAIGWLAAESGRLRLGLIAATWRGIPLPSPLLWLVASQANASLEELFPGATVTSITVGQGKVELEVRPR